MLLPYSNKEVCSNDFSRISQVPTLFKFNNAFQTRRYLKSLNLLSRLETNPHQVLT